MKNALKWISYTAVTVLIALFLYKYVFFTIIVPSPSMFPTIDVGDRIVTTRIHDASSIERGDILVFYSDEFRETMVKRVIGLPNDLVEIDESGKVSVNDQRLDEAYVIFPDSISGSFKVPEGKYFFLGDFRAHSLDSRKWNDPYIPEDNLLGEAKFILFPFERISKLD